MKKILYTLLITFIATTGWAQSEDIFTFNLFNQLNFNPATAGHKEVLDVGAIYRNQWWSGVDGAPKTVNVYGHTPFANYRSGIGLNIISDNIGLDRIIKVGADYAYRMKLSGSNVLSLGIGVQVDNTRSDWTKANDGVDQADNTFANGAETTTSFNFGPGAYFKNDKFYLGLSVPRVLANSLSKNDNDYTFGHNTIFLNGGLSLPIGRNIELLPNLQARLNGAAPVPFDMDFNVNVMLKEVLLLGVMYRLDDSIDGLIAYQLKNGLRIGFAMDFTTSDLSDATTGSFEVMLGYTFPCETCEIKNLRYF